MNNLNTLKLTDKFEAFVYTPNESGEYDFSWMAGVVEFEEDGFYLFNGERLNEAQNPVRRVK